MSTAVSTEMRKFFSTRLWWVLLLIMAGYMAFLAAVLAFSITATPQEFQGDKIDVVRSIYTVATSLGYVFPAIVGTLAVTSEFRHRTIVPTLLADPSRTRLLTAKMIAAVPIGLLFGIVGTVSCLGAGAGAFALGDVDPLLGSPEVWRSAALSVAALTVWSVVGVGLGAMLPNQVASLVTLLAFTQFVEPVARMALPAVLDDAGSRIASFLPGAAGEAMTGASLFNALSGGGILEWWQGALVLVGYALLFAVVGRATTFRRDIG